MSEQNISQIRETGLESSAENSNFGRGLGG